MFSVLYSSFRHCFICRPSDSTVSEDAVSETRARIFHRLWSPGIDSKELIPPAYVAWRAVTITLFLLGSQPHRLFKNSSSGQLRLLHCLPDALTVRLDLIHSYAHCIAYDHLKDHTINRTHILKIIHLQHTLVKNNKQKSNCMSSSRKFSCFSFPNGMFPFVFFK